MVSVQGPQLPVKRKELSFKEGVKLFFICYQGLGDLLLCMSAIMDAWVRGKSIIVGCYQVGLDAMHNRKDEINLQL